MRHEYEQLVDLARQRIDGTTDDTVRKGMLLTKRSSDVAHFVLKDKYCDKPMALCRAITHTETKFRSKHSTNLSTADDILRWKAQRCCKHCVRELSEPAADRLLGEHVELR